MAENIGSAKATLTIDTAEFTAKVAAAERNLSTLGTEAGRAFDASSGKARGAATSLSRYIQLIGKSADEAKILRAQWAGIDPNVLNPMVEQLQRVRAEEEANIRVARIAADARAEGVARAQAAYKELMAGQREDQLLREANAQQRVTEAARAAAVEQRNFASAVRNTTQYSGEYGQRVDRMRQAVETFSKASVTQEGVINRVSRATEKGVNQINQYGLTAKQQTAAMRQVPMQLTDIFVSLQGGQRPMTVLIQQGGQLKDIFGGIVPAARALGGALLNLINPFTALAAVVGGVGFLYLQAESRQTSFRKSLALTNNFVGQSAGSLTQMARALGEVVEGSNTGAASAALVEIAKSGKIAGDQLGLIARAAEEMRTGTGQAVSDTLAEFTKLADDPAGGLLSLDEKYHRLTDEQYAYVRGLQDAGDFAKAAAEANRIHAATLVEVGQQVRESMGLLEGMWFDLKTSAASAWDTAIDAMGRFDRQLRDNFKSTAWQMLSGGLTPAALIGSFSQVAAAADDTGGAAAGDGGNPQRKKALQAAEALIKGNYAREKRQELEETQIRNLYAQAGAQKILGQTLEQALAASRKQYESSKGKESTEGAQLAKAEADARLQAIKDAAAQEEAALSNSGKLLQAQYSARMVTMQAYYAEQRRLLDASTNVEADAVREQIAVLQQRNVVGKEAIDVAKQIGKLEADLAKILADGATQRAILTIQETDAMAKRQRAIDAYKSSLDESNEATRMSVNAEIARITMGAKAAEQQQKIADILAKGAKEERDLAREFADNKDTDLYNEKLADLRAYVDEQVRITEDGFRRMDEAQADWLNGVTVGVFDWMAATSNVAQQTNRIATSALDSTADAFANLALKGKFEIKSLLASILTDVTKFMTKQAILQFIKAFASYYTGGNDAADAGTLSDLYAGDSSFSTGFAKGAAFTNAHPSLSAYSGTVVNKPTPFYFARGAGVMGEAGMEGIFPLARDSNGKLGVKAMGGGMGGGVVVNVGVTLNSDGSTSKQSNSQGDNAALLRSFGDRMAAVAQDEIRRSMRPGGELWKTGVTTQ